MRKNNGPTGDLDPRGLISEAYKIDGIEGPDCRTIYFDWALGVEAGRDMRADTAALLTHYEAEAPAHPMTAVLREGLSDAAATRRRGGRAGRDKTAPTA
ncbi:MAG: hypothetical protein AAF360_11775 [Pseudomonadota bacterium]